MRLLVIYFFFVFCSLVVADDTAKICISDFGRTKAVPVSDFDSVSFPVSVEELIDAWGLGYRNDQISGTGIIYWRCIDGRIATVGPVSDLKTILNDPKVNYGDAHVSFFDADVEWYPFPRQISINAKKVKGAQQGESPKP